MNFFKRKKGHFSAFFAAKREIITLIILKKCGYILYLANPVPRQLLIDGVEVGSAVHPEIHLVEGAWVGSYFLQSGLRVGLEHVLDLFYFIDVFVIEFGGRFYVF